MKDTHNIADDPELEALERLARRMDSAFRIPLTGIRIGWDSLIGLIPGIGDAAAVAPAGYIVYRARQLGAPDHLLLRMGSNIVLDAVLGSMPLLGDLFDVGFKANRRNVALLRKHRQAERKAASAPVKGEGRLSSHRPEISGPAAR
ncbi:DUF4112 domain-containing protein [Aestuariibius sp. 2305UL40-4]|uniref:DUF4112 domain-containing protein n=1 Tax=Aestuariibius violaceus TaxID=3234132 RepID=UPI00345E0C92